jgi:hypothetical protein
MAEIKSESVADFIPESAADFPRNMQPGRSGIMPSFSFDRAAGIGSVQLCQQSLLGITVTGGRL